MRSNVPASGQFIHVSGTLNNEIIKAPLDAIKRVLSTVQRDCRLRKLVVGEVELCEASAVALQHNE